MASGVIEVTRYHFAKDFLEAIGYEYIWSFLGYALVVGFAISIASQLFVVAKGGRGEFIGVVMKYAMIALFIQFSEPAIHSVTALFVDSHTGEHSIDSAFLTAFNQLQGSFNSADSQALEFQESHAECQMPNVLLTNLSLPAATLFGMTYSLRILLFFLFVSAWMVKVALFGWIWPILYSFMGLGLVSAIVFSSLPGGGKAIFPFFKTVVQLSLWPMLYVAFVSLIALPVNTIFKDAKGFLLCPTASLVDGSVVALFVALSVIVVGVIAIPFVASSLMHHRGTASIGTAIGSSSVGALNSAVQLLEKSGGGVVTSGVSTLLSSASHSISLVSSQTKASSNSFADSSTFQSTQVHSIVSERSIDTSKEE
ncbi:hypothetical protein KAH37_07925 [bacterium]|nr:hypothetical protein [bacterium]